MNIPIGRAALISGFIRNALHREIQTRNWPFRVGEIISQRDYDSILRITSLPPHVIPEQNLIKTLSFLAYKMQAGNQRSDGGQVRIELEMAREIIGHNKADMILHAGVSLGVIDEDFYSVDNFNYRETVAFRHQLFQEYFAARYLIETYKVESIAQLVYHPWRIDSVEEPLGLVIDSLYPDEPLPLLPQTGWEETLLLVAAMIPSPSQLVRALAKTNLPLAGRCAAQPDVNISDILRKELQELLIKRIRNNASDLRHRISAGLSLGELGDPRYEQHQGPYGDYLLPPLIVIAGGKYSMGSNAEDADRDERDGPLVELKPFFIGKFPVTNAEWKCFMDAGGYDDAQWWDVGDSRNWWGRKFRSDYKTKVMGRKRVASPKL